MCLKCFNSFILSCFKYWSPVFSFFFCSSSRLHLKHVDGNLNACKLRIPELNTELRHSRWISCLCILFKVYHNPHIVFIQSFIFCFILFGKLEMLFAFTVIPSQFWSVVPHSAPDALFQHPLSIGMIFLVEMWTAWSFRNSRLVLISFYWTHKFNFNSLIVIILLFFYLDFIKFSYIYFPFSYWTVFPAGALGYIAYSFPVGVAVWL